MFCRLLQHADAGALCCFSFAADESGRRKKYSCSGLWGDTRTPDSTPHARTAQRAPVASIDSLRMTAVEHRAHTNTAVAVAAAAAAAAALARAYSATWYIFFFQPASRIEAVGLFILSNSYKFISTPKPTIMIWVLACSFKPDSVFII